METVKVAYRRKAGSGSVRKTSAQDNRLMLRIVKKDEFPLLTQYKDTYKNVVFKFQRVKFKEGCISLVFSL